MSFADSNRCRTDPQCSAQCGYVVNYPVPGPTGPPGAEGPPGIQGDQGPQGVPGPPATSAYAYVYNLASQSLSAGSLVVFDSNGIMVGLSHAAGTSPITVETAGTYSVTWVVTIMLAAQIALQVNGVLVPGSLYGSGGANRQITGVIVIPLAVGDTITMVAISAVVLQTPAGGTAMNSNAGITIVRIGS